MNRQIEELLTPIQRLFDAHTREQEGLIPPTPTEWLKTVDDAWEAFGQIKELLTNGAGEPQGYWEKVASRFPPCDPSWPQEKIEQWLKDFVKFLGVVLPTPLSQPPRGSVLAELVMLVSELDACWSFDENQRHTHNWHDKQDIMAKFRKLSERAAHAPKEGWVSVEEPPVVAEHDGGYFWVVDGDTVELSYFDGEDWYNPIGEGEVYGAVRMWKPATPPALPPAPTQVGEER